ncbi:MAG: chemotaxis protein CheW [Pseudomonadales bacterium]|nr:chemotaxis protein CheW [Pseudomonadales bacterium]MBO6565344.1 chemotaxis protein CheW [Pseudomonadales bacterium]MBO6596710.1 chemotaxis protein CheW [Pseudomonadales bacterium]MBO6656011.1 chemotaxis protein CheW [Pseudomonadales bacterium]MBO6703381.1 chemotaxis protein CheW [Pseudomonadales bacterium]
MVEPEQLQVHVLTMQKQGVIIPADSIAEIIPYEPLQRIEDTPDWFLGLLGWRGVQVPVVSFEMLTAERASFSLVSVASASLVIMRGVADQNALPFYALVSQTQPQHQEITPEMLFETGEAVEKTEVSKVRLHNDVLSVPNLDYIEAALLNALIQ